MFRAMRARPAPPERPGPLGSTTLRRVSGRPGRKVLASRSGRRRRVAYRTAGRARPGRRQAAWGRRRGPDTRPAHNRSRGPPRAGGRLARSAGRPTSPCHPPDGWGRARRSRPANPQPPAKPPRPARARRPAKPPRPANPQPPAKPPRPARARRPAKPRRPARPRHGQVRCPGRPRHGQVRRRARPRHGQVRRRGPGSARLRRAILGGPMLRRRPSKLVTRPAARTSGRSPRPRGAELVGHPPGPTTVHPPGGGRRPPAPRDHALPGRAPREQAPPGQAFPGQAPRARPGPAASSAGTRRSSGPQSTRARPSTGSGQAQVNWPVRRVSSRPPTMTSTSTGT
jgi:hypothetical protein